MPAAKAVSDRTRGPLGDDAEGDVLAELVGLGTRHGGVDRQQRQRLAHERRLAGACGTLDVHDARLAAVGALHGATDRCQVAGTADEQRAGVAAAIVMVPLLARCPHRSSTCPELYARPTLGLPLGMDSILSARS